MSNVKLNSLFSDGIFYPKLTVGLRKDEVEKVLGKTLGSAHIETEDIDYYIIDTDPGVSLIIVFDKEGICFDIRLDADENEASDWFVGFEGQIEHINKNTSIDQLFGILSKLNIKWEFDRKQIYLQTVCIKLESGLRLYYAFGNKSENDYGLFSIRSIFESHKFCG